MNTVFALIVVIFGPLAGQTVEVAPATFDSMEACVAAADMIVTEGKYGDRIAAVCTVADAN